MSAVEWIRQKFVELTAANGGVPPKAIEIPPAIYDEFAAGWPGVSEGGAIPDGAQVRAVVGVQLVRAPSVQ